MDDFTQRMLERAKLRREKLDSYMGNTSSKPCKLNRLAELATKINTWEDDVDHPRKNFVANKTVSKPPSSSVIKENSKNALTENQENKKPESNLKSAESKPKPYFFGVKSPEVEVKASKVNSKTHDFSIKSPEPSVKSPVPKTLNVLSPKMGVTVLKDMFENKSSPSKTVKDPAELSLKERRALFEKNKGEVLIPKVAFGTPLPAKKQLIPQQKEVSSKKISEVIEKKITEISQNRNEKDKFGVQINLKKIEVDKPVESKNTQPVKEQKINLKPVNEPEVPKENKFQEPSKKEFQNSPEVLKIVKEVKKIDVSPAKIAKVDRLYPSLSDIESVEESDVSSSENDSMNESKNSNIYLNMSFGDILEASKNNTLSPPNNHSLESNECRVLNQMDDLLDEALDDISSPDEDSSTPPKMLKSTSFEYKSNPDDHGSNQLIHTVSFYRKQQQTPSQSSTPAKIIKREEEHPVKDKVDQDETALVEEKIQNLLTEINTQQTQISQASEALNFCLSNANFSSSKERIECERVLLLASHKRQACLNEVHRLKVENSLRPKNCVSELTEKGNVAIKNMKLPLKREALHSMAAAESMLYFVCLTKCDEQVLATSVVPAQNLMNMTLSVPDEIKLINLSSDFKVTVEIYYLELSKELLPHDVKYHISGKKDKKLLTPIKNKKSDAKSSRPCIQSPGGPYAVRTSNFQMCGFFVFSLREISKKQWTLNKVPYTSPLEGSISLSIETQLRFDSHFSGFLTMFDDISGFGAWHRRWCRLASEHLSYWKYPDDENTKAPIGTIDLRAVVTENVSIASREICARLHTFLLETQRPRQENDRDSLVLNVQGDVTKIRHLLSADSKEEMLEWCRKLNRILALLRSWKCMP